MNEKDMQSPHAIAQRYKRKIELPDLLYVLKNGRHERSKTRFNEQFSTWNYAMRGKTVEGLDIRIIVAFDESDMLIITVMHVTKL